MATNVEEGVDAHSGDCGGGGGGGGGGKKGRCDCHQPPNPEPQPESDAYEDFAEEEVVTSDDDHEDDDKDEDPFVDIYGRHEMTNKEYRIYSRQVRRSGGFHVDKFPNSILLGGIHPVELEDCDEAIMGDLKGYTDMAIEDYNKKQNANLEFVRIVKANEQIVRGARYYITFEAKDSSGDTRNYQAVVWDGIWEKKVRLCRPEKIKQGDPKKSRLNDSHGV